MPGGCLRAVGPHLFHHFRTQPITIRLERTHRPFRPIIFSRGPICDMPGTLTVQLCFLRVYYSVRLQGIGTADSIQDMDMGALGEKAAAPGHPIFSRIEDLTAINISAARPAQRSRNSFEILALVSTTSPLVASIDARS